MKEQISALMDGELAPPEQTSVLDAMKLDGSARADWQAYWLVGDALRGCCAPTRDLTASVMEALDAEPTVMSGLNRVEARNDPWWSRAMPIAAGIMGVAVVTWAGLGLKPADMPPVGEVARASQTSQRAVPQTAVALSEAETDRAYLLAHHGYAGTQTMPGVGYYMRTVAEASSGDAAR